MDENINTNLGAQQALLKATLMELVRIPSLCDEGAGGLPFGEAIVQALRKALQIAGNLSFRTHSGDGGFYGVAEGGEGQKCWEFWGTWMLFPPKIERLGLRPV